jgi:hypothetical protein
MRRADEKKSAPTKTGRSSTQAICSGGLETGVWRRKKRPPEGGYVWMIFVGVRMQGAEMQRADEKTIGPYKNGPVATQAICSGGLEAGVWRRKKRPPEGGRYV